MTNQPSSSRGTQPSSKGTQAKRSQNTEGDDYPDSDEDDDTPLAAKRMLGRAAPALKASSSPEDVRPTTGLQAELGEQATTSAKRPMGTTIRPSDYETTTAYTFARETEIEKNRQGDDTQPVAAAEPDIPLAGTKKRLQKQRLFLYSSQESTRQNDETSFVL